MRKSIQQCLTIDSDIAAVLVVWVIFFLFFNQINIWSLITSQSLSKTDFSLSALKHVITRKP